MALKQSQQCCGLHRDLYLWFCSFWFNCYCSVVAHFFFIWIILLRSVSPASAINGALWIVPIGMKNGAWNQVSFWHSYLNVQSCCPLKRVSLLTVPSLSPIQLSAWMHLRTLSFSKSLLLVLVLPFHINLLKALYSKSPFPTFAFLRGSDGFLLWYWASKALAGDLLSAVSSCA